MKLEAKQRLMATWWDNLNAYQKKSYIENHPNSKYAKEASQGKAGSAEKKATAKQGPASLFDKSKDAGLKGLEGKELTKEQVKRLKDLKEYLTSVNKGGKRGGATDDDLAYITKLLKDHQAGSGASKKSDFWKKSFQSAKDRGENELAVEHLDKYYKAMIKENPAQRSKYQEALDSLHKEEGWLDKKQEAKMKLEAKQRLLASAPTPQNVDTAYAVNGIRFDNVKGLGNTPLGANIEYMGMVAIMRCSKFRQLAKGADRTEDAKKLEKLMREGRAIASPFLILSVEDSKIVVFSHEGRARIDAIVAIAGDIEIPVQLSFYGEFNRAKYITKELLEKISHEGICPEGTKVSVHSGISKVFLRGEVFKF